MPFSYLWACWQVTPISSARPCWVRPRLSRRPRSLAPICRSVSCDLGLADTLALAPAAAAIPLSSSCLERVGLFRRVVCRPRKQELACTSLARYRPPGSALANYKLTEGAGEHERQLQARRITPFYGILHEDCNAPNPGMSKGKAF